MVNEFNSADNDYAGNGTDNQSANRADGIAACRNSNKAGKCAVQGHGNIWFAVTEPGENHRGRACGSSSDICSNEDRAHGKQSFIAGSGNRGSTVKAKPTEPKNEDAKRAKGQAVTRNSCYFAVSIVFADTGPQDFSADKSSDAAYHVDSR